MTDADTLAAANPGGSPAAPAPAPGGPPPATPVDAGDLTAELRKKNAEANSLRQRLVAAETKLREHEETGLSELDKAQRRIADLEAQVGAADRARRAHAVERLLKDAQYPDLLLATVALDEIELDEAGTVRRGDALVRDLRTRYPGLWERPTGSGDGGAAAAAASAPDMNVWLRRHLGRPA